MTLLPVHGWPRFDSFACGCTRGGLVVWFGAIMLIECDRCGAVWCPAHERAEIRIEVLP